MLAGRLINRIVFQKLVNEIDEIGQQVSEWINVCTVWGAIIDQTGKEFVSSQSEQSITNCTIRIRFRNDITTDMRAVCRGIYYDIKAVLNDCKKTKLEIPCQKGVRYEN